MTTSVVRACHSLPTDTRLSSNCGQSGPALHVSPAPDAAQSTFDILPIRTCIARLTLLLPPAGPTVQKFHPADFQNCCSDYGPPSSFCSACHQVAISLPAWRPTSAITEIRQMA
ncbi:hypothetical protein NP493_585g00002 [Ridgeia piscesae]|uniref:Uncharacterized protein n=1 Tax=Ridgeia piscesae TaxID=27915 RepID=A0AAD9NP70_RIDPI|nr:hypothetical protein NP493_585g00002 [Ridgeia piscesae]